MKNLDSENANNILDEQNSDNSANNSATDGEATSESSNNSDLSVQELKDDLNKASQHKFSKDKLAAQYQSPYVLIMIILLIIALLVKTDSCSARNNNNKLTEEQKSEIIENARDALNDFKDETLENKNGDKWNLLESILGGYE